MKDARNLEGGSRDDRGHFTRFSNDLLEVLIRAPLSATQIRIVLCVIRHTIGYQGREWTGPLSVKALSKEVGVFLFAAQHAVSGLVKKGILCRGVEGGWALKRDRLLQLVGYQPIGRVQSEGTNGLVGKDQPIGRPFPHRKERREMRGAGNDTSSTPSPRSYVVQFKTNGTVKSWAPPAALLAELAVAFPGLDVSAEVLRARVWCEVNPKRRKTAGGMANFLYAWMGRSNNRIQGRQPLVDPEELSQGPLCGERDGSERIPHEAFA